MMADDSKAQKLASARKKFKELKKERKKNVVTAAPLNAPEPVEAVLDLQNGGEAEESSEVVQPEEATQTSAPLLNYFSHFQQQPVAFFDSFTPPPSTSNGDIFSTQHPHSYSNIEASTPSLVTPFEQPSAPPDEQSSIPSHSQFEQFSASPVVNNIAETEQADDDTQYCISSVESLRNLRNTSEEEHEGSFPAENVEESKEADSQVYSPDTDPPQPQYIISSVESLRQLQNQMAELIKPNADIMASNRESELEARNSELAALLEQEQLKNMQLNASLYEYQDSLGKVQAELHRQNLHQERGLEDEVRRLKEELQNHIQTVGILVAEKAELSANLSQFQTAAKQKIGECEELQGRLKTSRSRVADLEREISSLRSEKAQFDTLGKSQLGELEKLRTNYDKLRQEKDELVQDVLEARERAKSASEVNLRLEQQLSETSAQLSMASIKIQQLTTGELGQLEHVNQEKFQLQQQLNEASEKLKTMTKERDEAALQYTQYSQQLNAQIVSLAGRLDQLQKENEALSAQEQNRIRHIGELEKQLQNLQNNQVAMATAPRGDADTNIKAELDLALEFILQLQGEVAQVQDEVAKVTNEKAMVEGELRAKTEAIGHLEGVVEDLREDRPDNAKLLATMESDKVAAARAVEQNTAMKKQMESMQEVFMKLTDDKVDLTEELTTYQRDNKELFEKLQKTELHLQTLADAIEIKDRELIQLRENSTELTRSVLQSEQLTDRLRHYEAQDHSSHSLQTELQQAKQTVVQLTEEIAQLKEKRSASAEEDCEDVSELKRKLERLELENNNLAALNGYKTTGGPDESDSNQNVLDKEAAMRHLEKKFLRTMDDIAALTEEKQRLEHLVLQLQGETETIGEYVALYQHQRSILKQKAIEKDQQLSQLATDRELMKSKLEKLNELVKKLVIEKGDVPSELLRHHATLSTQGHELCEAHAELHSELNKITQNNLNANHGDHGSLEGEVGREGTETAQEIIALLSEIKSSNLVQPTENYHHCPWCSGQLITV